MAANKQEIITDLTLIETIQAKLGPQKITTQNLDQLIQSLPLFYKENEDWLNSYFIRYLKLLLNLKKHPTLRFMTWTMKQFCYNHEPISRWAETWMGRKQTHDVTLATPMELAIIDENVPVISHLLEMNDAYIRDSTILTYAFECLKIISLEHLLKNYNEANKWLTELFTSSIFNKYYTKYKIKPLGATYKNLKSYIEKDRLRNIMLIIGEHCANKRISIPEQFPLISRRYKGAQIKLSMAALDTKMKRISNENCPTKSSTYFNKLEQSPKVTSTIAIMTIILKEIDCHITTHCDSDTIDPSINTILGVMNFFTKGDPILWTNENKKVIIGSIYYHYTQNNNLASCFVNLKAHMNKHMLTEDIDTYFKQAMDAFNEFIAQNPPSNTITPS